VGGRAVPEHELVTPIRVVEEVEDPLLLHQTAGEVEVALPVLHAVVARFVRALQPVVGVEAAENAAEDFGDALVLEDPPVARFRQEPERGNKLRAIHGRLAAAIAFAEPGADAGEVPGLPSWRRHRQRELAAEQLLEGDGLGVRRDEAELEGIELRESFRAVKVQR
jgi:hypothetical protein